MDIDPPTDIEGWVHNNIDYSAKEPRMELDRGNQPGLVIKLNKYLRKEALIKGVKRGDYVRIRVYTTTKQGLAGFFAEVTTTHFDIDVLELVNEKAS